VPVTCLYDGQINKNRVHRSTSISEAQ
jgi:hypothetical protein